MSGSCVLFALLVVLAVWCAEGRYGREDYESNRYSSSSSRSTISDRRWASTSHDRIGSDRYGNDRIGSDPFGSSDRFGTSRDTFGGRGGGRGGNRGDYGRTRTSSTRGSLRGAEDCHQACAQGLSQKVRSGDKFATCRHMPEYRRCTMACPKGDEVWSGLESRNRQLFSQVRTWC